MPVNTFLRRIGWLLCGLGAYAFSAVAYSQAGQQTQKFVSMQPEDVKYAEGASSVVLLGDPSKPGMYVVQNTFAPGRGSRPHYHDQDRYVTVIKGTWWVALGPESDIYNPSKMVPMKPGSFVFHPAFGHHYDGAKDEEAVVRIMGMGPVTTKQLEPGRGRP
jgi:quercetin dioxygenase-like cupin family protein